MSQLRDCSSTVPRSTAPLPRDRAALRARDELRVLREDAARELRRGGGARGGGGGSPLGGGAVEVEAAFRKVEDDRVAPLHRGDRPACRRLGGDVARHQAVRRAGE